MARSAGVARRSASIDPRVLGAVVSRRRIACAWRPIVAPRADKSAGDPASRRAEFIQPLPLPRPRAPFALREQTLQQRDTPRLHLAARHCLLHRPPLLAALTTVAAAAAACERPQIDEPLHDRGGG